MRQLLGSVLIAGLLIVSIAGALVAEDEDRRIGETPVFDQRIEVPEAGLIISFPSDWYVDVAMDYFEADPGDPSGGYWSILSGDDPDGPWCDLTMHPGVEAPLSDLARLVADDLLASKPETTTVEVAATQLPLGEAYRVDAREPQDGRTSVFLFDGGRYGLHCHTSVADEPVWADSTDTWRYIAETIELLPEGPTVGPPLESVELQRVEMPGAGVAISLPSDWTAERVAERRELALPPGVEGEVPATTFLVVHSEQGPSCGMEMFEHNPLSLEEHVAWVEQFNREADPLEGTIDHVPVRLPVGEAIRVDGDHQGDGVWTTIYFFDSAEIRYLLYCADSSRSADDYRSIAETIELVGPVPEGLPVDAVSWGEVGEFPLTVAVSDDQSGSWLMAAWCDRALWIERPDGTFEERLRCVLTDDPVEPVEAQGVPPAETRFTSGGACEWLSDFWYNTDGSQFYAESWSMSVEPDGSVLALSNFGAEALDCS